MSKIPITPTPPPQLEQPKIYDTTTTTTTHPDSSIIPQDPTTHSRHDLPNKVLIVLKRGKGMEQREERGGGVEPHIGLYNTQRTPRDRPTMDRGEGRDPKQRQSMGDRVVMNRPQQSTDDTLTRYLWLVRRILLEDGIEYKGSIMKEAKGRGGGDGRQEENRKIIEWLERVRREGGWDG
ncbi:hypothetical protein Pmani_021380 [Petrolisthes manimaculis]|uniref:Uncharacterized protein n=1 Tax=Petrolisthes manimaculis TaxID=1843537 RepID=A0AAE1U3A1_9EUCA|nr:hypothetical protein Pmani_021380 [Petrolisthes manimaculis]